MEENDARTHDAKNARCVLRRDHCLLSNCFRVCVSSFLIRPFWMLILSIHVNLVYYTTPLRLHLHNAIFIKSVDGTGSVLFLLWDVTVSPEIEMRLIKCHFVLLTLIYHIHASNTFFSECLLSYCTC